MKKIMKSADYFIKQLDLKAHPEGGYFNETYRSNGIIKQAALPNNFKSDHCYSTFIYFLLKSSQISKLHRIKADEQWHFFEGGVLIVAAITENGDLLEFKLGRDLEKGEVFNCVVPANSWFGSYPLEENSFSLVGCTVAPGFEFEDFELANKETLLKEYPQYKQIIERLT